MRFMKSFALLAFTLLIAGLVQPAHAAKRDGESSYRLKYDPAVVAEIDRLIVQGWEDNEANPSEVASDEEWLRRTYLIIAGHVPSAFELDAFLKDDDANKRSRIVDELLESDSYVNNMTTVWTNLLIGRQTPRRTSREGMQKFLREAFARNRPWDDIVYDILTAEGHYEENGAVNYLLSQMTDNDEAVQVTAKTTRLFLGIQVQCTQCHNHPFNDWQQSQFWEFNSFFRQARRVDHRKLDPETGRQVDDYSELVRNNFGGPVYFEKRSGLMQVAYPKYFGSEVTVEEGNRQLAFAKEVVNDTENHLARAMVNRMWGQLFGYGFTRPIDDMGPHNPASHPELLEYLTGKFAESNFDLKMLVRWIANSKPYQLTSEFNKGNDFDDPSAGEMPLFSHFYVRPMEAEQLFDSLMVATNAGEGRKTDLDASRNRRNMWLRQFVNTFGTDENDESTTFNGSIPQALMMMNGELMSNATNCEPGTFLHGVVTGSLKDQDKVRYLYFAAVGRYPQRKEISMSSKVIRSGQTPVDGYSDLFWALLNSNEFLMIH